MPDLNELKVRLATIRPRLFLSGDRQRELREAIGRGAVEAWSRLREAADEALVEPTYPEPSSYRPAVPSDLEWLRTFTPGKIGRSSRSR